MKRNIYFEWLGKERRRLAVDVSPEFHNRIKVAAAQADQTMSELVRRAVLEYLAWKELDEPND